MAIMLCKPALILTVVIGVMAMYSRKPVLILTCSRWCHAMMPCKPALILTMAIGIIMVMLYTQRYPHLTCSCSRLMAVMYMQTCPHFDDSHWHHHEYSVHANLHPFSL